MLFPLLPAEKRHYWYLQWHSTPLTCGRDNFVGYGPIGRRGSFHT